jgi:hypothetical protein
MTHWSEPASYTVNTGALTANDATGTSGGANDNRVLANDTDAELNPLNAVLVSNPAWHITLNFNGTFTYVHDGRAARPIRSPICRMTARPTAIS